MVLYDADGRPLRRGIGFEPRWVIAERPGWLDGGRKVDLVSSLSQDLEEDDGEEA